MSDISGKVNLKEAFGKFADHWRPRVVGRVNDFEVKVAKLEGEFVWHHHEEEDELFFVVKGMLRLLFKDREEVRLDEGEFMVVPRGVEHLPIADEEVWVMLFEPSGTRNTGNLTNERTVDPEDL